MRIIIDAMGGDCAPQAVVEGAVMSLKESNDDLDLILTGEETQISNELKRSNLCNGNITLLPTTEVVDMTDKPSQVVKSKPDSSIVAGMRLLTDGGADAFVSAGSTGAILSTALLLLGRIEGVQRPALGVYFPTPQRGVILCDAGANVEVKPIHLYQFAIMASEYVKHVHGVTEPAVGLLNIGAEETKGQEAYLEAHKILDENLPTFYGNIESRYILDGNVNVVVCDGFVGNNIVKFAEGWIGHVHRDVSEELNRRAESREEKELFMDIFSSVMAKYEYEEYGGVPLLGVNGVCIVCHGASPARAIKNAILTAKKSVQEGLVESIRRDISATVSLSNSSG